MDNVAVLTYLDTRQYRALHSHRRQTRLNQSLPPRLTLNVFARGTTVSRLSTWRYKTKTYLLINRQYFSNCMDNLNFPMPMPQRRTKCIVSPIKLSEKKGYSTHSQQS